MTKKPCMIVDDSGVVRKISRKILEDLGFEVSEAEVVAAFEKSVEYACDEWT